jgi:hypothetical protein
VPYSMETAGEALHHPSPDMATTYITKDRRQSLINQYMECWFDTESYSTEEAAEGEGREMRAELESMNNSRLVAECRSTGWGIA